MVFGLIRAIFGGGDNKASAQANADNRTYVDVTSAPEIGILNQIDLGPLADAQRQSGETLAKALLASTVLAKRQNDGLQSTLSNATDKLSRGAAGAAVIAGAAILGGMVYASTRTKK